MFDGELDVPAIQVFEQKFEKSHFSRVDSDIIDRLIVKDEKKEKTLSDEQTDNLSVMFKTQMPAMPKTNFNVEVDNLGESQKPVLITQNEWMRRMKEMSRFEQGMSFYGEMPDTFSVVRNADHPLISGIINDS